MFYFDVESSRTLGDRRFSKTFIGKKSISVWFLICCPIVCSRFQNRWKQLINVEKGFVFYLIFHSFIAQDGSNISSWNFMMAWTHCLIVFLIFNFSISSKPFHSYNISSNFLRHALPGVIFDPMCISEHCSTGWTGCSTWWFMFIMFSLSEQTNPVVVSAHSLFIIMKSSQNSLHI